MKQATVNLPSGTYLIQEVPLRHRYFSVYYNELISSKNNQFDSVWDCFQLPPSGSWQLLGADPTALTEEEAGEIVEDKKHEDQIFYFNYKTGASYLETATASLSSLAGSLGISKPYVVLKNKNDDNT